MMALRLLVCDLDASVRRAAAQAIARQPSLGNVPYLLMALDTVRTGDAHLKHALGLASAISSRQPKIGINLSAKFSRPNGP